MHIYVSESFTTVVFFCWQHSSQNRMYWPDHATSKYKLILWFITVNSVGICIIFGTTDSHSLTCYSVYTFTITTILAPSNDRKYKNAHISATVSPIYTRFFSLEAEIKDFHLSHRTAFCLRMRLGASKYFEGLKRIRRTLQHIFIDTYSLSLWWCCPYGRPQCTTRHSYQGKTSSPFVWSHTCYVCSSPTCLYGNFAITQVLHKEVALVCPWKVQPTRAILLLVGHIGHNKIIKRIIHLYYSRTPCCSFFILFVFITLITTRMIGFIIVFHFNINILHLKSLIIFLWCFHLNVCKCFV